MEDRTLNTTLRTNSIPISSSTSAPAPTPTRKTPVCCYPARVLANFAIWWGVFLTPAYVLAVGLAAGHGGVHALPVEPPLAGLAMTVLAAWIGEADPRVRGPVRLALACNAVPIAVITALAMIRAGFL
jgi:hypothetical protein